jgi:ATP-dependent Lhr-like helicase
VQQHRSTIVFANSRRLAERLCARLNEIAYERATGEALPVPGALAPAALMAQAGTSRGSPATELARAHHGSVSKEQRAQIEDALKSGRLPAVVATSSLELGIDMGAVDLVVQVESPPSVASGLQRVGRAGHQVGAISRGVIFPKYRGDSSRAAVVADRMAPAGHRGAALPSNPLDVLAQQVVRDGCRWTSGEVDALPDLVRRDRAVRRPAAQRVRPRARHARRRLSQRRLRRAAAPPGLDRVEGVLRPRPVPALVGDHRRDDPGPGVVRCPSSSARRPRASASSTRRWSTSRASATCSPRARAPWRIEDITHDRVLVSPAPGVPGKLPFWHGDTLGRPVELGRALGGSSASSAGSTTRRRPQRVGLAGLDERATANLLAYLREQREATGHVPDDRTIVVEKFRDELGDWRIVLHSPFGAAVHAPVGARARGATAGAARHRRAGDARRRRASSCACPTSSSTVRARRRSTCCSSPTRSSRWSPARSAARRCSRRVSASAPPERCSCARRDPRRRTPLWQQRQRSAQLLSVASEYASFPIVLETVRECLQDVFDVPGWSS